MFRLSICVNLRGLLTLPVSLKFYSRSESENVLHLVYPSVCMCVCLCVSVCRSETTLGVVLRCCLLCFLRQCLSPAWHWTSMLVWLAFEPSRSACLCLSRARVKPPCPFLFSFLSLSMISENGTQNFVLTSQPLYHLRHLFSPQ